VKMRRFILMLGSVIISVAIVGSGSAFAANHPSSQAGAQTKAQWQKEIANLPTPGRGCYHASYPALQWHAVRCLVAPDVPLAPRVQTRGGPDAIGNGADYLAQVSGTISKATGTFADVSSGITEKGQINAEGAQKKNAFTLQLNTQFFVDPPACSGAADPSECEGWQQFVYAYHYSGSTNEVFMQYWMLFYDNACPTGWMTDSTSEGIFCYANSPATVYGALPASALSSATLVGQATSGGNDTASLSSTSGASSTSNSDSKLDLASWWDGTEWGVFGDAGGGQANFGAGTTLEAVTALHATSSSAPTCVANGGTTGETNNLDLTKTPALGTESSPTMASLQTNGTVKKAKCAVKS
jgi:hypothetical protein